MRCTIEFAPASGIIPRSQGFLALLTAEASFMQFLVPSLNFLKRVNGLPTNITLFAWNEKQRSPLKLRQRTGQDDRRRGLKRKGRETLFLSLGELGSKFALGGVEGDEIIPNTHIYPRSTNWRRRNYQNRSEGKEEKKKKKEEEKKRRG